MLLATAIQNEIDFFGETILPLGYEKSKFSNSGVLSSVSQTGQENIYLSVEYIEKVYLCLLGQSRN